MYLSLDIETQGLAIDDEINFIGVYGINSKGKELFEIFTIPEDKFKFKLFIKNRLAKKDKFILQNGKFDAVRILFQLGIDIPIHHDTLYLGYLFSTVTELKEHKYDKWLSLKTMAQRFLGVEDWDVDTKTKTSKSRADVEPYLRLDCKYTYDLFMYFKERLPKKKFKTYKLILKLANCYKYIEVNGVPIDKELLQITKDAYTKESLRVKELLKKYGDINYNSPKQLQELLFEKLGLPIVSYTESGQPSTGVETLKELQDTHPICKQLLELRMLEKALSFLKDWDDKALLHEDGYYYIHPTFNLHSTVTGRTSSNNPNFQQVPRNKDLKSLYRYPGDEYEFVCADFSQAELRFASLIAGVKNMKEAYSKGEDLHTNIAAIVNEIDKKDVTKQMRTAAKAVNFGFIYGMSAESFVSYAKLSYGVTMSLEDAIKFRKQYFDLYPELEDYYNKVDEELWYYGEQVSVMGRTYTIDIDDYHDRYKHEKIRRAAINFPVQSAASDYVLCALYGVMTHPNLKHKVRVCGTVHDSIIMLVKKDEEFYNNLELIRDTMQYPPLAKEYLTIDIDIPIVVDVEVGPFGKGISIEEYKEKEGEPV